MEQSSTSRDIYQSRLSRALAFINDHLAEELSLAQLAAAAHFSPFHFHRIFTAAVGETPHDFINRLRLEKAANMLVKSPGLPVTTIALACGFSSPAVFARSFKQGFGMAASAYRQEHRGGEPPATGRQEETGHAGPGNEPALPVEVRLRPAFHVAYAANLGGYNLPEIEAAWRRLMRWAGPRDLVTPTTTFIGISFDDPGITPRPKCRYYACLTVPAGVSGDETIACMDIPAGKCAVYRVTCRAEEIELAYRAIFSHWLPDSGYQPADRPCYEIYLATPETSAGPYLLDICIPIEPL